MRLKTYTAATIAEAMDLIRKDLGEEAIIVSTQRGQGGTGARVTAALEDDISEDTFSHLAREELEEEPPPDFDGEIRHALTFHGVPPALTERLVRAAVSMNASDPIMALAGALDSEFSFSALPTQGHAKPFMLIGPPGVGKTVTVAKLAARARLEGRDIDVISTDTQRAGGVEQLAAFTRILKVNMKTASTIEQMRKTIKSCKAAHGIYIDSAGTNPFSEAEMDQLAEFIAAADAEPVLVIAAGMDAMESADIAASFAYLGAKRLLVTRLDMARRYGSILAAADAGRLRFCDVSVTPHVADGLSTINPVSLARLIMPHSGQGQAPASLSEALP